MKAYIRRVDAAGNENKLAVNFFGDTCVAHVYFDSNENDGKKFVMNDGTEWTNKTLTGCAIYVKHLNIDACEKLISVEGIFEQKEGPRKMWKDRLFIYLD